MVADNKIRLVCTPDEFQGLRYQEWMKGACKLYKSLGRSPEAYLALNVITENMPNSRVTALKPIDT